MELLDELNKEHPNWLEWEPETIRRIINPTDEKEFNKIMALQTVYNSQYDQDDDEFHFTDWFIFEKIVIALNDAKANFDTVEEAEPYEIHRALKLLDKPSSFSEEVLKYIAASYKSSNIVYCPFIEEVNEYLDDTDLKKKVSRKWYKQFNVDNLKLEDTAINIQLRKLGFIKKAIEGVE